MKQRANKLMPTVRPQTGMTLVEVMVAILILSVLAVAGAASLQMARGMAAIQKGRRSAVEYANSRLEELRAAPYSEICPPSKNYNTYYLNRTSGVWVVSAGNPVETVVINGRNRSMNTTVQYLDTDGASVSYDALQMAVKVRYYTGSNDFISIETIRAP